MLQRSDVLLLAPGEEPDDPPWREFSFSIAAARAVDGQIRPGETIDLVATYSVQSESDTVVVFRDAPVLRITEASDGLLSSTGGVTITVALADPSTVLAAVNAVDDAEELDRGAGHKGHRSGASRLVPFRRCGHDGPCRRGRRLRTAPLGRSYGGHHG